MNLLRVDGRPLVIGHRGASVDAPENSRDALLAAVDAGVDLVEFDVTRGLVVAHDAGSPGLHLYQVLELLAPHGVGLHVDLKQRGDEAAVLEAVDRYGLRDRVLFSTAIPASARALAALAPGVPRAIGYPRDRARVSRFRWPGLVTGPAAAAARTLTPARIPLLLRATRANVLALHHTLCSPAAVASAHARGVPVLVWTVDEPARVRRFSSLGVDGIVSNDPRAALEALVTLTGP